MAPPPHEIRIWDPRPPVTPREEGADRVRSSVAPPGSPALPGALLICGGKTAPGGLPREPSPPTIFAPRRGRRRAPGGPPCRLGASLSLAAGAHGGPLSVRPGD